MDLNLFLQVMGFSLFNLFVGILFGYLLVFYINKNYFKWRPFVYSLIVGLLSPVISITIFYILDKVYNLTIINNGLMVFVFILPVLEETVKTFLLIKLLKHFKFKTVTEGFIYGAILGLGFAISENIYFAYIDLTDFGVEMAISTTIVRTLILLIGHPLYSGIIGSSISVAARSEGYSAWNQIIKMVLLHMAWNFVAFWLSQFNFLLYMFAFIIIVSIGISLYIKEKNFVTRFDQSLKQTQLG